MSARHTTQLSYQNQTVLIDEDEFIICDDELLLENSTLNIDGYVQCNANITLITAKIMITFFIILNPLY
jgi:hypothetical protein